ncbi:gamma-glutamyltransferase family protein [Salinisphaera sp. LB1]|uniref:gamma-glutamyltransferase family protein n=1 Tax=Salinisphaera sp. LB1 TaxID=2183911 RepID=UPI000D70555D|nr:gamma-glutamyltransferase [Salinisphaera sp. LB1]AWN16831.1 Gamma-glutamyltranspeptidase [Salinisphaera sp. LB1]
MRETLRSRRGMVVAPHHLAAQAGRDVLREGGNAIEAMIASAAAIAVVYPHMNSIGGDGFWLISRPGEAPRAIDACGPAVAQADSAFYAGHDTIPSRGPLAALTVAGTVGGWTRAQAISQEWGGRLPLSRLLADAAEHARHGIAVTRSQAALGAAKHDELVGVPGFAEHLFIDGRPPDVGTVLKQSRLADTLDQLARAGLDDFYRGALADAMAADLEAAGSPLRRRDLADFAAREVAPLAVALHDADVYNLPPPTQGLASLMILGLFDRLGVAEGEGFAHLHGLIEATKQAFLVRDREVTDPAWMTRDPSTWLTDTHLDTLAAQIDPAQALPWPQPDAPGDTVWLGCIDGDGCAVSFIQSIYWEFGSGVVSPSTGVLWQNRGISFSLDAKGRQALAPGRRPFHTLNPALARFADGRTMVYGTMGGEGQPQTQAAVFTRYARFGEPIQQAISAPRWLLGRTWGENSTTLKLESRFSADLVEQLRAAGHDTEILADAFSDTMGHAGAVIHRPDGWFEGGADPRSDGIAAGA